MPNPNIDRASPPKPKSAKKGSKKKASKKK